LRHGAGGDTAEKNEEQSVDEAGLDPLADLEGTSHMKTPAVVVEEPLSQNTITLGRSRM